MGIDETARNPVQPSLPKERSVLRLTASEGRTRPRVARAAPTKKRGQVHFPASTPALSSG